MSRAAVSMFVFGVYLLVLGPTLVVAPAFLTGLFGLGSPQEVWIRVLGAIVTILGFYYVFAARRETKDFFWATVWGRPFVTAAVDGPALRSGGREQGVQAVTHRDRVAPVTPARRAP